jgi:hypothetical protein
MRVALRHDARLMAPDALDRIQVHALLYEPGGQCMSHIVKPEIRNTGPISRSAKLVYQITVASAQKGGRGLKLHKLLLTRENGETVATANLSKNGLFAPLNQRAAVPPYEVPTLLELLRQSENSEEGRRNRHVVQVNLALYINRNRFG